MAKISSYPTATPESGDFVIGTDANDINKTVQFPISSLTGLNTLQTVLEAGDSSTVSFTVVSGALDPSSIDYLQIAAGGDLKLGGTLTDETTATGVKGLFLGVSPTTGRPQWMSILDDVPLTPTSSGDKGMLAADTTHLYVCIENDTWRRVAVSTW